MSAGIVVGLGLALRSADVAPRPAAIPSSVASGTYKQVEVLGRRIAETDAASWRATEALLARPNDKAKLGSFFALLRQDT